ncbi:MAG TPA: LytR C-terminal domain-containing protein [Acidimicrobiia bacterium]|nr:LytR C-terminal domain-containing protein [Acidimicrobiia bacterium]
MTDVPARRRRLGADSSFTRSFLGAFARGTGLIAVALALGVVLLQWSDASTDVAAGGHVPVVGTPVAPAESTTTTTAPVGPRAPGELAVLVLNATGKNQQAKPMSDRLAVVGYRTLTPGNAARRTDSVVLCKTGLEQEAAALVAATGLPAGTGVLDEAAASGMEGASEADCVVIIGSR